MDRKLATAVGQMLDKTAKTEQGVGLLTDKINFELQKRAEGRSVVQEGASMEHKSPDGSPSSASSPGMEDKNKTVGKKSAKDMDLQDGLGGGKETGQTITARSGGESTTEAGGVSEQKGVSKEAAMDCLARWLEKKAYSLAVEELQQKRAAMEADDKDMLDDDDAAKKAKKAKEKANPFAQKQAALARLKEMQKAGAQTPQTGRSKLAEQLRGFVQTIKR